MYAAATSPSDPSPVPCDVLIGRCADSQSVFPTPLRKPVAVLVGLSALLFTALSLLYAGDSGYGRVDAAAADLARQHLTAFRGLFSVIQRMGDPLRVVIAAMVLALISLALGKCRIAVIAIAGPILTGLTTIALKPIVGRTRYDDFAFPSGHAAGLSALCLVVALILIGLAGKRVVPIAVTASVGVVLGGGMIGLAVATRGGHYLTDTLGSFLLAITMVFGLGLIVDRLPPRKRREGAFRRARPAAGSTRNDCDQ